MSVRAPITIVRRDPLVTTHAAPAAVGLSGRRDADGDRRLLLTLVEAADLLGISRSSLYRLIVAGN